MAPGKVLDVPVLYFFDGMPSNVLSGRGGKDFGEGGTPFEQEKDQIAGRVAVRSSSTCLPSGFESVVAISAAPQKDQRSQSNRKFPRAGKCQYRPLP